MLAATAINDVNNAKTPANDERTAKQLLDLLRGCVGSNVKIFRTQTNQQIAHRTTDDVAGKTSVFEGVDDIHGVVVDQAHINAVRGDANVLAFTVVGFFSCARFRCCAAVL